LCKSLFYIILSYLLANRGFKQTAKGREKACPEDAEIVCLDESGKKPMSVEELNEGTKERVEKRFAEAQVRANKSV